MSITGSLFTMVAVGGSMPLYFEDLKYGTWFTIGEGIERHSVWVKRREAGYPANNAWSPRDGGSTHFENNQPIHTIFNVKVRLEEVPR